MKTALALVCLLAGPVWAGTCDPVWDLQRTGQGALTQGASCSDVITLGVGPERVCHWVHDFRAASAQQQFDALVAQLSACLEAAPRDQIVNHPDSYDLRQFGADLPISLSLKDKGALGQTLVFLRVARP